MSYAKIPAIPERVNNFFSHLLYETKGIEQFQVIQRVPGKVIINIQKNEFYNTEEINRLMSKFNEIVGNDLEAEIVLVPEIEMHKSGKRKPVLSEISSNYL